MTSAEAYDAYLRGLSHMLGRSGVRDATTRFNGAIAGFEQAVALDPKFALGHAMLASAYTQRFFYDATDPAYEAKAFVEIERALAINPDQAEAYLARAQLVWNVRHGFQHEQAVRDLQRAVANNPSLAEAYVELGEVLPHRPDRQGDRRQRRRLATRSPGVGGVAPPLRGPVRRPPV